MVSINWLIDRRRSRITAVLSAKIETATEKLEIVQSFYETFTPLWWHNNKVFRLMKYLKQYFYFWYQRDESFRKNKQKKAPIQTIMKVSHSIRSLRLCSWGYNEYIRLKKYIKMSFFFEVRRYSSLKWKKSFPFFLETTYQKNN